METGDTSYSSITKLTDDEPERVIAFLKQAVEKKLQSEQEAGEIQKQLEKKILLIGTSETAIHHLIKKLKHEYPLVLNHHGNESAVIYSKSDIRVIPKID